MALRIRTILLLAFLSVGVLPAGITAWSSYHKSLDNQIADVRERHLVLAGNLSAALKRYESDIRATLTAASSALDRSGSDAVLDDVKRALNIRQIIRIDTPSSSADSNGLITFLNKHADPRAIRFSPVRAASDGENVIYAIHATSSHITAAEVSTDYFRELQANVIFGEKGHAAIVDHEGNILAHPRQQWIAERRNISKVSAVARMMNGETGTQRFYSPALESDMIAGLTAVKGPGWGVMVPQPIAELEQQAWANVLPIIGALIGSLCLSLILLSVAVRRFASPLEQVTNNMHHHSRESMPQALPPLKSGYGTHELHEIIDAYNAVVDTVSKRNDALAENARLDAVTEIGNRAYFYSAATKQINKRVSTNKRGVLVFLDIDNFKDVNDSHGHAIGDAMLREFAKSLYPVVKKFMDQELRGAAARHPVIGRVGGDEFAIAIPITDDVDDYVAFCAALIERLPSTVTVDNMPVACRVSAGGALYPEHGEEIEDLLRKADIALYHAKRKNRGQFEPYDEKGKLGGRSEIRAALIRAMDLNELVLEYQPKYCLKTHRVQCVEALLRWEHPKHGMIAPGVFLPAIEQTHIMSKLGDWVIRRAIEDIQTLETSGHRLRVAVNVASVQFNDENFPDHVTGFCRDADFDPARLQIEITEDAMESGQERSRNNIRELRAHGVKIAIDDYGKGYSNISRLARLPVDIIKLDRTIVWDAVKDKRVDTIMRSAIDMVHALDACVVVEGVETLEQLNLATSAGADGAQGFYFTKSLSPDILAEWLDRHNRNNHQDMMAQLAEKISA